MQTISKELRLASRASGTQGLERRFQSHHRKCIRGPAGMQAAPRTLE
jgi:hypothetical protein